MQNRLIGIAGRAIVAVGVLLIVFSFVLGCKPKPEKFKKAVAEKIEGKAKVAENSQSKKEQRAVPEMTNDELDKQIRTHLQLLKDKDEQVRRNAASALGRIGPAAKEGG